MDEISQREKREVLRNDSYFSRQQNTIDDAGGRYARITPSKLTGQGPSVPEQPASSPWSRGLDEIVGVEGPLEIDIDFVGDLGGASPAQTSNPRVVETIVPPERGESSPTALTELSPQRRRRL